MQVTCNIRLFLGRKQGLLLKKVRLLWLNRYIRRRYVNGRTFCNCAASFYDGISWQSKEYPMALGKLPVPGRPTNLGKNRARAYCACSRCGWGFWTFFSRLSFLFSFSLSLWGTAQYRLKYCLKGPLSPKQPTNQPSLVQWIIMYQSLITKSALQGPVVQNIVSLTSWLRSQLVKCFKTLLPNTLISFVEKWERFSIFFNKTYWHIGDINV